MRQINQAGIDLIRYFESCRLTSYQDGSGIWTIGWGHTQGVVQGQTCTQDQADQWFLEDVTSISQIIDRMIPSTFLTPNQFSACVSLAYNIGTGRFSASTLLKFLKKHDMRKASAQFLRWNNIDGKPNDGLLRRRQAEQQLFNSTT